jgi:methylenetetrahydrofolate reductase (NADPH)
MAAFSIEATRPKPREIEALRGILEPGTWVYLSSVSTQGKDEQIEAVKSVRRAGFEPVPHLAARRFVSLAELRDYLARLRGEADVRRALVIGGDKDDAEGPFATALSVIESGLLGGFDEVGIAGYPQGHPQIAADELEAALARKLATAREAGLRSHIVSQFCFDPGAIVAWLRRLRAQNIDVPVHVGLVGPTKFRRLLRYARRCGVSASIRGLWNSGALWALLGKPHPGRIVRALAAADGIGDATPHYFSFGGLTATAHYARDADGMTRTK